MSIPQAQASHRKNASLSTRTPFILMADDDPEDVMLIQEALEENSRAHRFASVADGEELLKLLRAALATPEMRLPDLILLDLNMPRKDGRETLKILKQDPKFRVIPVIVLSTSDDPGDIHHAYELGANSFISKPSEFSTLLDVVSVLSKYWLEVVCLP